MGAEAGGPQHAPEARCGERPLGDFVPAPPRQSTAPLGDVARLFRKEKLATKKAEIVFEKQGS